jgi:SAM-dependent methyltransferase
VDAFVPETLYDLIVGGDVIEHLDDPWTTLRRMWDWLRPGGYLLLSVPNAGHWSLVADQAAGRFPYLPWGLTCITHRRWFTEAELKRSLAQAGYVPQRWEREQPPASPRGEAFIRRLVRAGMGDETSLRSLQIRVLAQKI